MPRKEIPKPTDNEVRVLNLIWDLGVATVEDVLRHEAKARGVTYTTVQSTLNRMVDKGLLLRVKEGRAFRYVPRVNRAETQRSLVGSLLRSAFSGSARAMVLSLLRSGDLSPAELRDLEKMRDAPDPATPPEPPAGHPKKGGAP